LGPVSRILFRAPAAANRHPRTSIVIYLKLEGKKLPLRLGTCGSSESRPEGPDSANRNALRHTRDL